MIKAGSRLSTLLMVVVWAVALSLSAIGQTSPAQALPADFKSDGCSFFPDGNYRDCCVEHDKVYYFGGIKEERKAADRQLRSCVRAKGHRFLAPLMYLGVRIGGGAWLPTPFRWGFGKKDLPNKRK